jgi:hypothetical protein
MYIYIYLLYYIILFEIIETIQAMALPLPKQYERSEQPPNSPQPSAPDLNLLNDSIQPESKASAPPIFDDEIETIQRNLFLIAQKENDLTLDVINSRVESMVEEVNKLEEDISMKCDKQCDEANKSIESNTIDDFLKKEMNNIFNK